MVVSIVSKIPQKHHTIPAEVPPNASEDLFEPVRHEPVHRAELIDASLNRFTPRFFWKMAKNLPYIDESHRFRPRWADIFREILEKCQKYWFFSQKK